MQAEVLQELVKTLKSAGKDASALWDTLSNLNTRHLEEFKTFDYSAGPSILSLKVDSLLSYTHHLLLSTLERVVAPKQAGKRNGSAHDQSREKLRENLIRLRLVLEKSKPLENKLKHHVDRLLRAAQDEEENIRLGRVPSSRKRGEGEDVDLLAFGPNTSAILSKAKSNKGTAHDEDSDDEATDRKKKGSSKKDGTDEEDDGIYRPPKLMPVSYDPDSVSKRKEKRRALAGADDEDGFGSSSRGARGSGGPGNRALLSELMSSMSANPYEQSSTGTGINRPLKSGSATNTAGASFGGAAGRRAAELERMREYEEENFTRLALSKKDERRRRRDEEDLALGGGRGARGRSGQSAGFEAELGGLLGRFGDEDGAGGRKRGKKRDNGGMAQGDSYEALRRSKARRPSTTSASPSAAGSGSGKRRRPQGGQFEKGLKRVQKKMKR